PLSPEVGQVVQAVIEKGYRDFTGRVAKARERTVEQVDQVARGRVWSGAQARERGRVDACGGLRDAIDDAAARAELGKPGDCRARYVERMATPFRRFFADFAGRRIGAVWLRHSDSARELAAAAVLADAVPQARGDLRFLDAA